MSVTSTNVVVISNVPDIHGLIDRTRNIDLSTESSKHEAITTMIISGLEALLQELGLNVPIPPFPSADVLNIPLDIGRSYFADILCSLIGCDAATAYNSIQLPNSVDNGDLAVILPRLSPGGDSDALGFTIKQNVWSFLSYYLIERPKGGTNLTYCLSFHNAPSSTFLLLMECIFESCSNSKRFHVFYFLISMIARASTVAISHLAFAIPLHLTSVVRR